MTTLHIPGQPQSVDMDIVGGDFDSDALTVKYSDGKEIEIPLTAKPDLFSADPCESSKGAQNL